MKVSAKAKTAPKPAVSTARAAAKKAVKKSAPITVKKAAVPSKAPKSVVKPAVSKTKPVKPATSKTAASKAAPSKAVVKKAQAPKAPASKSAVAPKAAKKSAVAKKSAGQTAASPKSAGKPSATLVKAKAAQVKPVAKSAAQSVAKPSPKPATKVASAKPVVTKAAAPATPAPQTVQPLPSGLVPPVSEPRKLSGRAAKAAAGVPPPPSAVPFSNPAKASFGPFTEDRTPAFIPVMPQKDPKLTHNWKTKPVDQLTDAEVLAMPDTEYMNDTQLAFFRLKLQALKRDILNSAGETTEHLREDTVIVPDPADRATIEEEHALELRTRDRERKLLKKIEQSIHLIDNGDYGYCDETGEPIGVPRLLARPTATLSLEAQQRRELTQKMFGD